MGGIGRERGGERQSLARLRRPAAADARARQPRPARGGAASAAGRALGVGLVALSMLARAARRRPRDRFFLGGRLNLAARLHQRRGLACFAMGLWPCIALAEWRRAARGRPRARRWRPCSPCLALLSQFAGNGARDRGFADPSCWRSFPGPHAAGCMRRSWWAAGRRRGGARSAARLQKPPPAAPSPRGAAHAAGAGRPCSLRWRVGSRVGPCLSGGLAAASRRGAGAPRARRRSGSRLLVIPRGRRAGRSPPPSAGARRTRRQRAVARLRAPGRTGRQPRAPAGREQQLGGLLTGAGNPLRLTGGSPGTPGGATPVAGLGGGQLRPATYYERPRKTTEAVDQPALARAADALGARPRRARCCSVASSRGVFWGAVRMRRRIAGSPLRSRAPHGRPRRLHSLARAGERRLDAPAGRG